MTNLMTEVNFEQYCERMSSVDDKKLIKDYINSGTVLDFGCGEGSLSQLFSKEQYTGYDLSEQMIKEASTKFPYYHFVNKLNNDDKFDHIVFSSVIHEIYSYNDFSFETVVNVLTEAKNHLKKNGNIIIRDGIQPLNSENIFKSFTLVDPIDAEQFLTYLIQNSVQSFDVVIENDHISGSLFDLINFLNIYTWGWKSVDRELNERVNFADLEQWFKLFNQAGLEAKSFKTIVQNNYFEHLNNLVELNNFSWETKVFVELI